MRKARMSLKTAWRLGGERRDDSETHLEIILVPTNPLSSTLPQQQAPTLSPGAKEVRRVEARLLVHHALNPSYRRTQELLPRATNVAFVFLLDSDGLLLRNVRLGAGVKVDAEFEPFVLTVHHLRLSPQREPSLLVQGDEVLLGDKHDTLDSLLLPHPLEVLLQ